MNDEKPPYAYKLVLVPADGVQALSRGLPQVAVIKAGTYEVAGDVDGSRCMRVSRQFYDLIEVIEIEIEP